MALHFGEDIHVHVHVHADQSLDSRIKGIEQMLRTIVHKEDNIVADLANITAAVEAETTVEASAITLLNQLGDAIRAAGTDQTALDALATQVSDESAALAAAVAANTTPPPAPPTP